MLDFVAHEIDRAGHVLAGDVDGSSGCMPVRIVLASKFLGSWSWRTGRLGGSALFGSKRQSRSVHLPVSSRAHTRR